MSKFCCGIKIIFMNILMLVYIPSMFIIFFRKIPRKINAAFIADLLPNNMLRLYGGLLKTLCGLLSA